MTADVWEMFLTIGGVLVLALLVTFHPGEPAEDRDWNEPDEKAERQQW